MARDGASHWTLWLTSPAGRQGYAPDEPATAGRRLTGTRALRMFSPFPDRHLPETSG